MLALALYPGSREQSYVAVKTFNILSTSKSLQRRQGASVRRKSKSRKAIPTARSINVEVQTLRRFSESPNNRGFFTPLLSAFHEQENVYLVMRMYPESLSDRLAFLDQQGLRLTFETIRFYAAELIFALESLHTEHRTLHCDLKPQNILIAPGHLCLADFGLSIHCFDGPEMRAFMVPKNGTPYYWPPECYDADSTHVNGVGLDTYALGRIFYELFQGSGEVSYPLMRLVSRAHSFGHWGDDILFSANIPDRIGASDFIRQMISLNPGHRPSLSHLKNHDFFAGIDWHKVGAREYIPRYRPDPEPRLYNRNAGFNLPSSVNCLNSERLGVEEFIAQLDFDYGCSENFRFDPLHDV
ncbi:kinase-like domain-containing protein [Mycena capillaripes]|nr:kinase-like domain-containing protein [Mycena capillaripes]